MTPWAAGCIVPTSASLTFSLVRSAIGRPSVPMNVAQAPRRAGPALHGQLAFTARCCLPLAQVDVAELIHI